MAAHRGLLTMSSKQCLAKSDMSPRVAGTSKGRQPLAALRSFGSG